MNRKLSVFGLSALLSLAGAVMGSSSDTTLKEIADYRHWTRVNEKPIVVTNLGIAGD